MQNINLKFEVKTTARHALHKAAPLHILLLTLVYAMLVMAVQPKVYGWDSCDECCSLFPHGNGYGIFWQDAATGRCGCAPPDYQACYFGGEDACDCPPGASGPAAGPAGLGLGGPHRSGCSCQSAQIEPGMPVWWVSELNLTLWFKDTPMSYQPSRGNKVEFVLFCRNNAVGGMGGEGGAVAGLGTLWSTPWLSYVKSDNLGDCALYDGAGGAISFQGFSTADDAYYVPNAYDYRQRWTAYTNNSGDRIIQYINGAKDVFDYTATDGWGNSRFFLTQRSDPYGNQLTFSYGVTNGVVYLASVTDPDSHQVTFTYTNVNSQLYMAGASDAYGHSVSLGYDSSGNLTSITDAAQLTSYIQYYDMGYGYTPSDLVTPYGTNSFTLFDGALYVNEVGIAKHLYVSDIATECDLGVVPPSYASYVPSTTNSTLSLANMFDTENMDQQNTYYWGPRQYELLPSGTRSDIEDGSFTSSELVAGDFFQARQRHWLMSDYDGDMGSTLSLERDPSPDGTTQGQITWYDYVGKPSANQEGTFLRPSIVAWLLPNGQSRFTYDVFNQVGNATNIVESYGDSSGTIGVRTNIVVYSTNLVDVLALTNALGVCTEYNLYDNYHRVLTNYDALSEQTIYSYDGNGRLTSVTHPIGLVTTNIYAANGYLAITSDLGLRTNSYTWADGLVACHTNELGLVTANTWDGLNRLRKVTYPDGTYITNSYLYLDLVKVVDRMGFATSYGYDGLRRKIAETNALGNYTLYDYCTCGSLDSIQDAAGNFTTFTYDNAGRRLSTTYPDGYVMNFYYDLMSQLTNTVDSGGTSVTNWYDNQGLTYAVSNAFGQVSYKELDVLDRLTNAVDANGVSVSTTYDNLNRPLTRTYPDNGVEKFGYTFNYFGLTSYTNQVTNIVLYSYDCVNRKTNEVYVGVTTNKFNYDPAGDLLTLTDGKSQATTWDYDSFGRATNKLDAASNLLFVYQYDDDNRLTNRWSATKGSTTYSYDAAGNLTKIDYPVSPAISLSYDVLNRLTNMVDAVGTTVYGYDAVGQLLSEDGPWADDTVSYTYDNRLRTGMSIADPNASAWIQDYGYDSARRLKSVTSPVGYFGYYYDLARLRCVDELTLPGGAYITNTFDNVARLNGTWLKNSGGTSLDSYAYGYNQANQRTNVVRTAGDYVNYTYDNMGELKSAIGMEAGGVTNRWQEQFGYVYDAAGNLNIRTNNTLLQQFNVNNLNELTTITNGGLLTVAGSTTSPATNVTVNTSNAVLYADVAFASTNQPWVNGNNTYTAIAKDAYGRRDTNSITVNLSGTNSDSYDLNGNLLSDGKRGFDYDDENQLIRVTVTNAWKSEFTYDGKMRRRITKEFTWNGSSWTQTNEIHFIYDGNVVVQERNANNLPLVTYTRGNDLSGTMQGAGGIGGLLARTDNGQLLGGSALAHALYHADGNGNVTCLIYTNQTVAAKYLYDPFGTTLSQYGALADANSYHFSSKEWNANSGLYYYLYRFYDPNLQRWVNRDPLMDAGSTTYDRMSNIRLSWLLFRGELRVPNGYEFVNNAPVIYIDNFGLQIWQGPGTPAPPNPTIPCNNCPPGQKSMPYWKANNFPDLGACMDANSGQPSGVGGFLFNGGVWGVGVGGTIIGGTIGTTVGIGGLGIGYILLWNQYVGMITCMSQVCH